MKEYKNGSVKFDIHELNNIAILAGEAARIYKKEDLKALYKWAMEFKKQLYDICEKHGLYDDLK